MSKSHTPTPWYVTPISGHDTWGIRSETPGMVTTHVTHGDADFIVRAVNAHDALVSALEDTSTLLALATDYLDCETDMRELGGGPNGEPGFTFADLQRFAADARAALKLAKD